MMAATTPTEPVDSAGTVNVEKCPPAEFGLTVSLPHLFQAAQQAAAEAVFFKRLQTAVEPGSG